MVFVIFHIVVVLVCCIYILLKPHRQPESRVAWLLVVLALPYFGVLMYLLLGKTSIGRGQGIRLQQALAALPQPENAPGWSGPGNAPDVPGQYAPLFNVAGSINGYTPVGGNRAQLLGSSDAVIEAMVADIVQATRHVHLLFYIWLDDHNGSRLATALQDAARRGVTCRAMVDGLGSRALVGSRLWKELEAAGVHTRQALKVGNLLVRMFDGRVDLRNHRKILVVDNRITYCGSQNCADPAFLPKARYAPWVDAVMRFEGPVVRQNQHLFASDWMGNGGDDLTDILREPLTAAEPGFTAQAMGTGPTFRNSAMAEVFISLIYAARRELFVTTPYYVPDRALQAALCACANRGVDTSIIFPARNDDFAVGATSRSYYRELLRAGVKVYEFLPGLLHTKSLTLDGEMTLIGSANMDRRSFDLNYENNILLYDQSVTAQMRTRQASYQASSRAITLEEVENWGMGKRLWNNTLAILGPIL